MDVTIDSWAWLDKTTLTPDQIVNMERMLTVHPQKMGDYPGDEPEPIPLYVNRDDGRFGVPREFFFEHRRPIHKVDLQVTEGDLDSFWMAEFVGDLRPEQKTAVNEVVLQFKSGRLGGIVQAKPGWGKCQKIGTPILKYDGTIVPVEEICEGDLLMGPDSTPRRVQVVSRGHGPLYKIIPKVGEPWECNDVHILTLVHSLTGEIVDVEIGAYLNDLSKTDRHYLKQFTPEAGIDFPSASPLPLDPYFLGVWFGDGSKGVELVNGEIVVRGVAITKSDVEIRDLCEKMAADFDLKVRESYSGESDCPTFHLSRRTARERNRLLDLLREVVGDGSKVPLPYLTASRADRQALLAGFIDTDGHNNSGCLRVAQKRRTYADAVAFLARSLGIRATIRPKPANGEIYWRVNMAGDFSQLPLRIPRKRPGPRRQKKIATRTGFKVEPSGEGEYVGFVLDGDGRYLLGDFTVTHNTVAALAIIAELKIPTLIVVHKEFLMDQWSERIQKFLPAAKIGRVQQDECDFHDKTVVMGMVHSLGSKAYPHEFYSWPGLVITDEVHRIGARTWSVVPPLFKARYRLGFTATPRRKDGADAVFWQHIGPIIFAGKEERLKPLVKRVWSKFRLVKTDRFNPHLAPQSLLLKFLCGSKHRNGLIADQITAAISAGRKCLVLSSRLNHLQHLEDLLKKYWPGTPNDISIGKYVGGRKKDQLEEAAKKQVILATIQYAAEGLDIPALDTLFLTTPMSDVEQAVGRILRPYHGKKDPIVVDFRDDSIPMFEAMGRKRDRFYSKVT